MKARKKVTAQQRLQTAAPFFSLARGEWVPYAFVWDGKTGEFHYAEGPRGVASYREAVEASRLCACIL